jgi:hypothetical protein
MWSDASDGGDLASLDRNFCRRSKFTNFAQQFFSAAGIKSASDSGSSYGGSRHYYGLQAETRFV